MAEVVSAEGDDARATRTRQPYADGMDGGPDNPLGARALYLLQGNKDTLYRMHGTNEPPSIGKAVSCGCIRMLNQDVIDLYNRVPLGTKVVVLPAADPNAQVIDFSDPAPNSSLERGRSSHHGHPLAARVMPV